MPGLFLKRLSISLRDVNENLVSGTLAKCDTHSSLMCCSISLSVCRGLPSLVPESVIWILLWALLPIMHLTSFQKPLGSPFLFSAVVIIFSFHWSSASFAPSRVRKIITLFLWLFSDIRDLRSVQFILLSCMMLRTVESLLNLGESFRKGRVVMELIGML